MVGVRMEPRFLGSVAPVILGKLRSRPQLSNVGFRAGAPRGRLRPTGKVAEGH